MKSLQQLAPRRLDALPFVDIELPKEKAMARVPLTVESVNPGTTILNVESVGFTPKQFVRLCHDNPDLRLELTARKEIVIMPPAHSETGWKEGDIYFQLRLWTEKDATGMAFGPNAGFTLPNGAVRSPDASWIRRERWDALTQRQKRSFAPICPDFIVELRSVSDTVAALKEKMSEYIANDAQLGWLIDPFEHEVHVYQPS
ncbi:MAG: hypothetical protein AUI36_10350, partial [Cyanobacteria bacterium 13_1_40CM_2_61_4]